MADKSYIEDIKNRIGKGFLHDNYGSILPIAFIVDHTLNNQKFYYICNNVGRYYINNGLVEFSAYVINNTKPSFWPPFGLYLTDELRNFTGHAIATSISGIPYLCNNIQLASRSLYLYDIKEIEQVNQDFIQAINDFRINIFTRAEDYVNILKRFNIPCNPTIVPDFNIEKILEIVNGLSKKE